MKKKTKKRKPKNPIAKGSTRSQEVKDKISVTQRKRWDQMFAEGRVDATVRTKRCNRCGLWKEVGDPNTRGDGDFGFKKKVRADGTVGLLPASECRRCAAARTLAWRAGLDEKELRKRERRWNRNRRGAVHGLTKLPAWPLRALLITLPVLDEAEWPSEARWCRGVVSRDVERVTLAQADAILVAYGLPHKMRALWPRRWK